MVNTTQNLKLDLSAHTDKYASDSLELLLSKNVNFIFGKNGTGKTTISNEIALQFSNNYSVHVYKDFEGVAINERLDAVTLGVENASIQEKVNALDSEIALIKNEVQEPENQTGNLYTKAADAKKKFDNENRTIERFYTASASKIKSLNNPTIASPNYNTKAFQLEIAKACNLTDEQISTYKETVKAEKKSDVARIALPTINLEVYLKSTNEVLHDKVKQSSVIPNLDGNPQKQQFAKIGMDIHEHKADEICAFCGSRISEERWVALGNHFNDEVKALERRILLGTQNIQGQIDKLNLINDIDKHLYYAKYGEQAAQINKDIKLRKSEQILFLEELKRALEEKHYNLFAETNSLSLQVPADFTEIQEKYANLISENNLFSRHLANEQTQAKDALRYHEIQKELQLFRHAEKIANLTALSALNDAAQGTLNRRKGELITKQQDRLNLISQTKDERRVAVKINELLGNMGFTSFELELVEDEAEGQKGQYKIKGHNGNIRPVTELSKGEKNIIAFLYFMLNLEQTDNNDDTPKIVVLDDPMTSNDDTMQYIMINEIQRYYRNIKDTDYLVILTHNIHFYLNVRPNTAKRYTVKIDGEKNEVSFYEKYGVWHLLSDGKRSTLRGIEKGKNDFITSYETLWKELIFLYNTPDATTDLMLNPCRKICETYMHFTKKDPQVFYENNAGAKKLFDVNQHSVDDLEAEMNGKTKQEIKVILKNLFQQNAAEDHFNNYWKGN